MPDKLCANAEEVGKLLGLSKKSVYDLMNSEGFPVVRIGRRLLVPIAGLERWLDVQASCKDSDAHERAI